LRIDEKRCSQIRNPKSAAPHFRRRSRFCPIS
jgi:hypothetical protein